MKNNAMRSLNRILLYLLIAAMLIPLIPVQAAPADENKCGDDLYWSVKNNVLIIYGNGEMYDYLQRSSQNYPGEIPWRMYFNSVSRVEIREGCTCIGKNAFAGFVTVSEVFFPKESLKEIRSKAFYNCTDLAYADIPDSVETIGTGAFSECSNLAEVRIGKGLKEIAENAFASDSSLVRAELSEECRSIKNNAFGNCSLLHDIDLSHVERIESRSFQNCALENAHFGRDLKYMQSNAFAGCQKLSDVTFDDGIYPVEISNDFLADTPYFRSLKSGVYTMFDGKVLMNKGTYSKTTLTVPEGIEIISDFCFDGASSLRTVSLPESLKKVGRYAFRGCRQIKKIYIPDAVEELGTRSEEHTSEL